MLYVVLLFIIGTIFGSFYTVVAERLVKDLSIVTPASHCDNCQKKLAWYELIPIVSYIIQGGKCRKCHKHVSILSTIVELITGLSFGVIYYFYGFTYDGFLLMIIASLTIIIFITDFKEMIILDSPLITSGILIVGLQIYYFDFKYALLMIVKALAVFVVIYIIKLSGDKAFKQESLGGGDVKLGFIMGLVLGIRFGLIAFALGAFIALPYALLLQAIKKEHLLAFGPFLVISISIVYLFYDYFIYLYTLL